MMKETSTTTYSKKMVRAIEIAIAGRHNIFITSHYGTCDEVTALVPLLLPELTQKESQESTEIWGKAGIHTTVAAAPFRVPHQTSSVEGMFGGGYSVVPGEISLAHNGVMYLEDAAQFRTSVLQLLRVPLESKSITLSRAGRSTVFPANLQLIMAMRPCPCGNYLDKNKPCLCTSRMIDLYWRKVSPLLAKTEIRVAFDEDGEKIHVNLGELKRHIEQAFEIQRKKRGYNNSLSCDDIALDSDAEDYIKGYFMKVGEMQVQNILRVALTIANMDGRDCVNRNDASEAISLVVED